MKKNVVIVSIVLLTVSFVPLLVSQEKEPSSENNDVRSLDQERRETLMYGINKEIVEVINTLIEEKNEALAEDVFEVFKNSYAPDVLQAALDYFIEIDYKKPLERASTLLDDYKNTEDDVIIKLITYLSRNNAEIEVFKELTDHRNTTIATAAVKALGVSGNKETAPFLTGLLGDDSYPSSIKPAVILALGDLAAESAVETLKSIVENETENSTWRRYACDALGKIGAEESIETLKYAASSQDPILRSYAVYALRSFKGEEIETFLIQSLKDSFWQVREKAAEGLGTKETADAIPILIYKAEHDPEIKVRIAAIKALSKIGGGKAVGVLKELYLSQRESMTTRMTSLEALLDRRTAAAVEVVNKIIQDEWEKKGSHILGNTCKALIKTKAPALQPVFARLLKHHSYIIRIYALRGIQYNSFSGLRESVEKMTGEQEVLQVRKTAESVLESFSHN